MYCSDCTGTGYDSHRIYVVRMDHREEYKIQKKHLLESRGIIMDRLYTDTTFREVCTQCAKDYIGKQGVMIYQLMPSTRQS